jgi:hypothetical protein
MNDLGAPWIGIKLCFSLFCIFLSDMYSFRLIKKKNLFFSLKLENYFHLFSVFLSNLYLKITSIVDLAATHYIDNINKEFELLYVNIFYKLNFRFFFKILLKKEDLIVSTSNLFKSMA